MKTQSTNGETLVYMVFTNSIGCLPDTEPSIHYEYKDAVSEMWDLFLSLDNEEIENVWDDEKGDIVEIEYTNNLYHTYIEETWLDSDEIAELENPF